jgi:Tfp pilus assembly protein PilN
LVASLLILTCQCTLEATVEAKEAAMRERTVEAFQRENGFLRQELAEARRRLHQIASMTAERAALLEAEGVVREAYWSEPF